MRRKLRPIEAEVTEAKARRYQALASFGQARHFYLAAAKLWAKTDLARKTEAAKRCRAQAKHLKRWAQL